jgi:hypothetical protein
VLGELAYAYVVGRVDMSYAVAFLARYSSAPDRCHNCASTFDTLSIGESYTGDKRRATFDLPVTSRSCLSTTKLSDLLELVRRIACGDFENLSIDNKDLSDFLKLSNLLELVRRVACHCHAHPSIGDWPIILPRRRCYSLQFEA